MLALYDGTQVLDIESLGSVVIYILQRGIQIAEFNLLSFINILPLRHPSLHLCCVHDSLTSVRMLVL